MMEWTVLNWNECYRQMEWAVLNWNKCYKQMEWAEMLKRNVVYNSDNVFIWTGLYIERLKCNDSV